MFFQGSASLCGVSGGVGCMARGWLGGRGLGVENGYVGGLPHVLETKRTLHEVAGGFCLGFSASDLS